VEQVSRFGTNGMRGHDVLSEDSGIVLARARRDDLEEGAGFVLIKFAASEQPAPATLDRLAHEYSLKHELDSTWAVRPLELVRDWRQTVLVLEDLEGEPLSALLVTRISIECFLRIAIGVAAALAKVHRHGLIHKDIKPAHILVNTKGGSVRLTGFGIASRLTRERQPPEPPELIAGTLAYMAPEQTGRMNRSIDSRSDLYSLGVTLYEVLTAGILPFTASDPMEWVYCHIARQALPPSELIDGIPVVISSIVMKLLAKTAEERYQTASGVEADLRCCLDEWRSHGRIDPFRLGAHDIPDRLRVPEVLYGRDNELSTLKRSFDRVAGGDRPELVLVSGYSGVGKSSIVNELHKGLVPPSGLFASGKFDQYKRDIPYATLAQAFQSLIRPLLSKTEEELVGWRASIREALGPNGLLIVDLVPELKQIIGEQPQLLELPTQDAHARFQMVFRRFIGVFARPEHPLALFLDDLQWLDPATLDLIRDLLTQTDVRYLLLIGAYRDNEVRPADALTRKLDMMRKDGAVLHEIALSPLHHEHLSQLLVDCLHADSERVEPLARLIHEKTAGNPFFAIQFLSSLADQSLLAFDYDEGRWSWDLNRIRAAACTDNVVELMVAKLNRLSIKSRETIQHLACIGNGVSFDMLRRVSPGPLDEVHELLWEAVNEGLIFRSDDSYRFLHDRVQEAAYSLMPEALRAEEHLRIGLLLAAHAPSEEREEMIFEIVNQLNRGPHLIRSAKERAEVAQLNLVAGRRASISTAYASALTYLRAGRSLLDDISWEADYDLIFSIELLAAECELQTAEMIAAETRLSILSQRAKTSHDFALVTRLQITLFTALDQSDRAVDVFLKYLRRGGTIWSQHPTREEVMREYERVSVLIGNRKIEELVNLPLMTNGDALDTLDVLTEIVHPALFFDENLSSLAICRMVSLSLEAGNCGASCFGYVWFAMIAGPRFNNYADGYRFGEMGIDLVEARGLTRYEARTYLTFATLTPWTKHFESARGLIRRAFDAAHRNGDLTFSAYSWKVLITNYLMAGDPLAEVEVEADKALAFATKSGFGLMVVICGTQRALVRTLRGLTPEFGCFDHEEFDEMTTERHLAGNHVMSLAEFFYWTRKLQARFLAGDYAAAVAASERAQHLLWTATSQVTSAELPFYGALARAASWDSAPTEERQGHLDALYRYQKQLAVWTGYCPANFENRTALVSAEIARIEGRPLEAEQLYEKAIRSAHANRFVHNEAIANELAGRFYKVRDLGTIADAYLRNARYCYLRWGADGKVRHLDQLYPELATLDKQGLAAITASSIRHLDVESVVKASQALSEEIDLSKLMHRLMTIALENAGAERGLLILPIGDKYLICAEAQAIGDRIKVTMRREPIAAIACPESLIRYVIRSQKSVILDNASQSSLFSGDDYFRHRQSKSVLCLPLIKQRQLAGVLLLENSVASHVFTPARITVLELLAAQAAISLDNSRLYGDLEEREAKVRRLVDSNIIGIYVFDLDGRIIEANEAFLNMIGYGHEDLALGLLRWTTLTPPEWKGADETALAELASSGTCKPFEKEYFRKDGNRAPVLLARAIFSEVQHQGVAFALDLSERKQGEAALREAERRNLEAQVQLAHANRVATLGQLAASIAHEVNQPIGATLMNAGTAVRWLARQPPDLEKAIRSIDRIITDGKRAADIVSRIRGLAKKAPMHTELLEVNETILEIMRLTRITIAEHSISVKMQLSQHLPQISGDKIQLQQVILNLIMNAVEAMADVKENLRELVISTSKADVDGILVTVRDLGLGLPQDDPEHIFDPFYTTKDDGLGMGLSICRSIVEAHGGRLWAKPNEPYGAVFCFMLPTEQKMP
jgi:PAS domain S-box-containing protein